MSRWSHLDSDEERLPEGFERIGYDGERYTYRNTQDGSLWAGPAGARYGGMRKISNGEDGDEGTPMLSDEVRWVQSPA